MPDGQSATIGFRYDLPNGWKLLKLDGSYSIVAPHVHGEDAVVGTISSEVERFVTDMNFSDAH